MSEAIRRNHQQSKGSGSWRQFHKIIVMNRSTHAYELIRTKARVGKGLKIKESRLSPRRFPPRRIRLRANACGEKMKEYGLRGWALFAVDPWINLISSVNLSREIPHKCHNLITLFVSLTIR